jgi:predicted regulator of Ras-like GTPase activity (Roadblock/LC7/MglB family)
MLLLANNQGRLLRTSRPIKSDDELLPSMIQAFEVLAQTLTAEFGYGEARMVQISTERSHIVLYPLIGSTYYVVVIAERAAPLMLLLVELERVLASLSKNDFAAYDDAPPQSSDSFELDAQELIEAVEEWLRQRPLDM